MMRGTRLDNVDVNIPDGIDILLVRLVRGINIGESTCYSIDNTPNVLLKIVDLNGRIWFFRGWRLTLRLFYIIPYISSLIVMSFPYLTKTSTMTL